MFNSSLAIWRIRVGCEVAITRPTLPTLYTVNCVDEPSLKGQTVLITRPAVLARCVHFRMRSPVRPVTLTYAPPPPSPSPSPNTHARVPSPSYPSYAVRISTRARRQYGIALQSQQSSCLCTPPDARDCIFRLGEKRCPACKVNTRVHVHAGTRNGYRAYTSSCKKQKGRGIRCSEYVLDHQTNKIKVTAHVRHREVAGKEDTTDFEAMFRQKCEGAESYFAQGWG